MDKKQGPEIVLNSSQPLDTRGQLGRGHGEGVEVQATSSQKERGAASALEQLRSGGDDGQSVASESVVPSGPAGWARSRPSGKGLQPPTPGSDRPSDSVVADFLAAYGEKDEGSVVRVV